MARYIDADALTREDFTQMWNDITDQPIFEHIIEQTPTADVVEVKHGRWIEDGYYDKPCVCSNCGEEAKYISRFEETFDYDMEENLQSTGYEEIREYIRTPYCPNCGAKMDGKG
jgi:hypothetical protein